MWRKVRSSIWCDQRMKRKMQSPTILGVKEKPCSLVMPRVISLQLNLICRHQSVVLHNDQEIAGGLSILTGKVKWISCDEKQNISYRIWWLWLDTTAGDIFASFVCIHQTFWPGQRFSASGHGHLEGLEVFSGGPRRLVEMLWNFTFDIKWWTDSY